MVEHPEVWPHTTMSMCSWHVKHIMQKYFKDYIQHLFAASHAPLDYMDTDPDRRWNAEFLVWDAEWVTSANEEKEMAWCASVKSCLKGKQLNQKEVEAKILEAGKDKKFRCIDDKDLAKKVIDWTLDHLGWHPYVNHGESTPAAPDDIKDSWVYQTHNMHALSKEYRLSWM
jgi:hypothetical protein